MYGPTAALLIVAIVLFAMLEVNNKEEKREQTATECRVLQDKGQWKPTCDPVEVQERIYRQRERLARLKK